jgi:hypothetical protein
VPNLALLVDRVCVHGCVIVQSNLHRSNAQELIAKVPVIEVAGNVAVCDGGTLGAD